MSSPTRYEQQECIGKGSYGDVYKGCVHSVSGPPSLNSTC